MDETIFCEKQLKLIALLADGLTIEQAQKIMTDIPFLVPVEDVCSWLRDPKLLQQVIEQSNDLIAQAWGTMWLNLKRKAMLGSVPHSKLLIEFIQNGKKLPDNTLKFIFDQAMDGGATTDKVADNDN